MKITFPSRYSHISLSEIPCLIADALSIASDDMTELIKYEATVMQWNEVLKNAVMSGHLIPLNPMTLAPQPNVHGSSLKSSVISRASLAKFLESYVLGLTTSEDMLKIKGRRPIQLQLHQEEEILNVLKELKYDLSNLPVGPPGKKGIRHEVREHLKKKHIEWANRDGIFDKAWERVLKRDEVKRKEKA